MKPTLFSEKQIAAYEQAGYWPPQTLSDVWDNNAHRVPNRTAYADDFESVTWAEINDAADRFAVVLVQRLSTPGQLVLLIQENVWEAYALRIALQRAGLVAVIAPLDMTTLAFEEIVRLSKPAAVIVPGTQRGAVIAEHSRAMLGPDVLLLSVRSATLDAPEDIRSLAESAGTAGARERQLGPFELDTIRTTSGSTGLPKLVETPSPPRVFVGRQQVERLGMDDNTVWLSLLGPHSGLMVPAYYSTPLVAGTNILLPRFSGQLALDRLVDTGATHAGAVPTQLARILGAEGLKAKSSLRGELQLRAVFCGGAVLPDRIRDEFESLTGCVVFDVYGMTEGSIGMEAPATEESGERLRMLKTYPGVEMSIRREVDSDDETGEIWVSGPCVNSGYFGDNPLGDVYVVDENERLWMKTGDMGFLDADGNLKITGRLKEVIIRGGLNIWPAAVEMALLQIPGIQEVACVPVPDSELGERMCACIVIDGGSETDINLEFLQERLTRLGLPKTQWPEYIHVVDELPLVTGQKVDRAALKRLVAEVFHTP